MHFPLIILLEKWKYSLFQKAAGNLSEKKQSRIGGPSHILLLAHYWLAIPIPYSSKQCEVLISLPKIDNLEFLHKTPHICVLPRSLYQFYIYVSIQIVLWLKIFKHFWRVLLRFSQGSTSLRRFTEVATTCILLNIRLMRNRPCVHIKATSLAKAMLQ